MFDHQIQQAYNTRWVVNCEPSLTGAEHVNKYLGQYTHRVAITNQRILKITDGKVSFIAKDYRGGSLSMSGMQDRPHGDSQGTPKDKVPTLATRKISTANLIIQFYCAPVQQGKACLVSNKTACIIPKSLSNEQLKSSITCKYFEERPE